MTYSNNNPHFFHGSARIGTVAAIPTVLSELGYDPAAVLNEIDVDVTQFADPEYVIPFALRSQIIMHCVHTTHCAHFGLLVGQHTGLSALGLLGFLVQQSADVLTALQTLIRYAHLQVRGAVYSFEYDASEAFLGYSLFQPNVEARLQIEDGAVAVASNIMRKLIGPRWKPNRVAFAHRKPADVRPFQNFFKAPLKFDTERNGVFFPASWLQQAVPDADPELRRLLQQQIDQLEAHTADGFVEQVQRVLSSAVLTQDASIEKIAALFSIHPRTLHRRLKAYNTHYQQLVDETRFRIARQLLEDSAMEITQIAALLQYTDPSAFTRAFRRWSGTTPQQWRKQHL